MEDWEEKYMVIAWFAIAAFLLVVLLLVEGIGAIARGINQLGQ